MIVKNCDAIHQMITRLETIQETDDTVSNVDRRWIHQAILNLQRVNGIHKVTLEENLRILGYDTNSNISDA